MKDNSISIHIEYDDFGEYVEVLEDFSAAVPEVSVVLSKNLTM